METTDEHSRSWVGFDLDGTLAEYHRFVAVNHIGLPIDPMIDLLKQTLANGMRVKIFTARANPNSYDAHPIRSVDLFRAALEVWCLDHIGQVLPITFSKDRFMLYMYDDRAFRVEANTGLIHAHAEEPTARHPIQEILRNCEETFGDRNRTYGDSYLRFGKLMMALYPEGFSCDTEEAFVQLGVIVQIANKIVRYCSTPAGHKDSAHDLIVYAAILEQVTEAPNSPSQP